MASNNWDDVAKRLAEQEALQNKVNTSAAEYLKLIKEIGLLEQNIKKLKGRIKLLDNKNLKSY
jgi:predicted  nucleic acid-binding Zn-ribbon protein